MSNQLRDERIRPVSRNEQSIQAGASFLDKKYSEKLKTPSTNSTSIAGAGFQDIYPALTQHKPALKRGSLIVETEFKGQIKRRLLIESEAALVFQKKLHESLAYDQNLQTWYQFTGTHWQALETDQLADRVIVGMLYSGTEGLGFRTNYKNGIKSLLADGGLLPLPQPSGTKLPFSNGLLDLSSKHLNPITPENAHTWCLPYKYDPTADCPNIKAWLTQAVDDDLETAGFLRAWMAAVLHGRNDLQKFLHLKGSGGTGKGTFMRLLTALVGTQNTIETKLDQLEQNRFESAMLYGKRLAIISESDRYGGSINMLKAITGQDSIRLERKHKQQTGSFVFEGMVIMASNESLQSTDHTSGLDRRRITVIFDRRATTEEKLAWKQRGGEEAVLHSELPGLVNWLIGLSQDDIFRIINNPPKRIVDADFEAMTATNPIADWLTECCEPDSGAWAQIGDKREIKEPGLETIFENADKWLYPNYLLWSQRANKSPLSNRRFKDLLIQTCTTLNWSVYKTRQSKGNGIVGLRIRGEDTTAF